MLLHTVSAPSRLRACAQLPASKSISNRALVISALAADASGATAALPANVSDCDDTRVMVGALRDRPAVVDIMAAGTAMRFLTAYYSVTEGERVITGTERMRHRPIGILVDALRALGADIDYVGETGYPPLRVRGRQLEGGALSLPGNVSSQYISALMMIGPTLKRGLTLVLTGNIVSRPYIDLTANVMHAYGASAEWLADDTIEVKSGGYRPTPYYIIENDWSAASYWYEMVALSPDAGAEVRLPGLFRESGQGDSEVSRLFERLGVKTEFTADGVVISKDEKNLRMLRTHRSLRNPMNPKHPNIFTLDITEQPDLAQTMVVTCCLLGVPFRFSGLQSLRIKETDRITALEAELRKWGYVLHDADDSVMWWDGERCEADDSPIDTYEDHRMAMVFAPGSLVRGSVAIRHPQVVTKSYPTYWEALRAAGYEIKEDSDTL